MAYRWGRRRWRAIVGRLPVELIAWPFELLLIVTSVSVVGLSIVVDRVPPAAISHTVGPMWAVGWSVLLLVASVILLRGLQRDELEGLVVGLRMHGILILTYCVITLTVRPFPLSVLGVSLMVMTGLLALVRACSLNKARYQGKVRDE